MSSIEEVKYSLPDIESFDLPTTMNYEELRNIVLSPTFRIECDEKKLDTPIKYEYRGRTGYIRVQKFLLTGLPVEQVLIQVGKERSYAVHPDYEQTAVGVEREVLLESGKKAKVTSKKVRVSEFQIELNREELFLW